MKLLRLGCCLVRIFCSFLRVLLIPEGLDAETYASDLKNSLNNLTYSVQSEMHPRYNASCEMKFTLHAQK